MQFSTTTCDVIGSSTVCSTITSQGDLIFILSCILFCQFIIFIGWLYNAFLGKTTKHY